jgi:hypothetical protein
MCNFQWRAATDENKDGSGRSGTSGTSMDKNVPTFVRKAGRQNWLVRVLIRGAAYTAYSRHNAYK